MSEQDGYRLNPNERKFTSEIFNPTDESHDSQGEGVSADAETGDENSPDNEWYTGNKFIDAGLEGWRAGAVVGDKLGKAVTDTIDKVTGWDQMRAEVAEYEQRRMDNIRADLVQRSQQPPSSETDTPTS